MSRKQTLENLRNMRALGRVLRLARKQVKKTQGAVAEEIRLARTTLIAIEAGNRKVSSAELIRFARCYNVAVQDLLRASEATTQEIELLSLTEKQKHLLHMLLTMKPEKKIIRTLQFVGMKRDELEQIASALLHELLETEDWKVVEHYGEWLAEYRPNI